MCLVMPPEPVKQSSVNSLAGGRQWPSPVLVCWSTRDQLRFLLRLRWHKSWSLAIYVYFYSRDKATYHTQAGSRLVDRPHPTGFSAGLMLQGYRALLYELAGQWSRDCLYRATFCTNGSAIDDCCPVAGEEGDDVGHLRWLCQAVDKRRRPVFVHEFAFSIGVRQTGIHGLDKAFQGLCLSRAWQHRIDRNGRAFSQFGQAAGNRQLSRLTSAVVSHRRHRRQRHFARDEDHATMSTLEHRFHVCAR